MKLFVICNFPEARFSDAKYDKPDFLPRSDLSIRVKSQTMEYLELSVFLCNNCGLQKYDENQLIFISHKKCLIQHKLVFKIVVKSLI